MKRNLLLFSLMVICSNLIFAMPLDTRKQIKMKVRVKIETVYYEKTTSFEKIKFINLDKHYKTTEYTLKVSSPLWVAVGVISIE